MRDKILEHVKLQALELQQALQLLQLTYEKELPKLPDDHTTFFGRDYGLPAINIVVHSKFDFASLKDAIEEWLGVSSTALAEMDDYILRRFATDDLNVWLSFRVTDKD